MFHNDLKFFIWALILGASLVTFANSNFVTRPMFNIMYDQVSEIRADVKELKIYLLEKK